MKTLVWGLDFLSSSCYLNSKRNSMFNEIYEGFCRFTLADWTTTVLVLALLTWGWIKIDKLIAISMRR